jgi:hypothetical protein
MSLHLRLVRFVLVSLRLRFPDPVCPNTAFSMPSGILFIAASFHDFPCDTSSNTLAPVLSACGAKNFNAGKIRLHSDPMMFPIP